MKGSTDLRCILVIDDQTKSKMNNNIADLAGYGVMIIDNIREITKDMLKKTRKVVLLGTFRFDGLDDLKIHKDLLKLEYYLITDDQLIADLMMDFCKCYLMDYRSLNSTMIYSILYDDKGEQSRYLPGEGYLSPRQEIITLMETTGDGILRDVCMDYLRLRDILNEKIKKESSYIKSIRTLESQNLHHLSEISAISQSLNDLIYKALKQNEVLREHEIIFSKDFYDKIYLNAGKFSSRPKILYFKEYEELIHERSFIKTLFDTFTIQGKLATKVVRLHDSCDVMRISKLSENYYPVNGEFLESKVVSNDYILSFGNYKKLLEFLMINKYRLNLLIIIDCKKFNDVVLEGDRISYYYLCRNFKYSRKLNLNEFRTISNNSDSVMSWDTFMNYNQLRDSDDTSELFRFLSSREPIKRIFNNIKNYS